MLQESILRRLRIDIFDSFKLARWTSTFVKEVSIHNAVERREVGSIEPKYLEQMGFGPAAIREASGRPQTHEQLIISGLKRLAQFNWVGPRKNKMCIEEVLYRIVEEVVST